MQRDDRLSSRGKLRPSRRGSNCCRCKGRLVFSTPRMAWRADPKRFHCDVLCHKTHPASQQCMNIKTLQRSCITSAVRMGSPLRISEQAKQMHQGFGSQSLARLKADAGAALAHQARAPFLARSAKAACCGTRPNRSRANAIGQLAPSNQRLAGNDQSLLDPVRIEPCRQLSHPADRQRLVRNIEQQLCQKKKGTR